MFDDLLRDPSKYETGVSELLQELMSGSKTLETLSPMEQTLLDNATLDFNRKSTAVSSSNPESSSAKTRSASSSRASTSSPADDEALEERPPKDLPPNADVIPSWLR